MSTEKQCSVLGDIVKRIEELEKAAEQANADNITNLQDKFTIQTADIGDLQVTKGKLEDSVQQQLTFLQSVPAQEFGTSNSVYLNANSNSTVDFTF